MKKLILIFLLILNIFYAHSQNTTIDQTKIKEDLDEIIHDISGNYVYLQEKNIDLNCIKSYYENQISNIKTEEETVLFFEFLLYEFYDNHLTLRTNRRSSFRLFAPIYTTIENGKPIITNVWQTQIENLNQNIIGAEIIKFNTVSFEQVIKDFPTHCHDKNLPETKEWIANKILAGRYNEPRIVTLKLPNNKEIEFDLDAIQLKKDNNLLTSKIIDQIGVIRINNSLGDPNLVSEFDSTLNRLLGTKGLIIDLRNTIFGGNTYEARGIMSRFINEPKPYQKHSFLEKSSNNTAVERSWIEYVSPRLEQYKGPVVILVGRWTGSMGEGLAIGFEGMGRAKIVGTEMRRLAGEVYDFGFKHQKYGYKLSTAKLYHVNGTIREKYIPENYVHQTTTRKDEALEMGINLVSNSKKKTASILKDKLEQIGVEDQTLRLLLPEVTEKFGRESNEYTYIWSLINKQDSICRNKLVQIIDTHGWLGKSSVGMKANQAIWLIMQHSELAIQKKYLPLLKESVANGESEGWHLAFLEDRILMYSKEKQKYGTQAVWNKETKKTHIYPIENVSEVNKRRREIGLKSIEYYAKQNGYIFDIHEHK